MTIPRENWIAAFPPVERAGNVTLGALTLGGAIRLAREGVDCQRAISREDLFKTAFVLAGEADYRKFLRRARCGLQELSKAVATVLNTAFETRVKAAKSPEAKGHVGHLTPHGIGWTLEYAEWLCAEYGWSWETAIETPLVTVLALVAAHRQRNGGKTGGLDYIEKKYAASLRKKKAAVDKGKEEAV